MATATQSMRKFLNDPERVVKESLAGLAAAHGDILRGDPEAQTVVPTGAPRAGARPPAAGARGARGAPGGGTAPRGSGGGPGREPLHGGFVGLGMLDAACPG